jgi:hypothetical protein
MKAIKQNWQMVVVCVAMLATALFIILSQQVYGNITTEQPAPIASLKTYSFFATSTNQQVVGGQTFYGTTTTATSTNITQWFDSNGQLDKGYFVIAGAKKVNVYLTRGDKVGGGNAGATTFKLQVTPNGTDWFYFNDLSENATTTQGVIALSYTSQNIVLTGTSTKAIALDLTNDAFLGLRVIAVETTDGSHEAFATAEF